MKSRTITEGLKTMLGERQVARAFFSTYSFEPDFFELDVLPLLLGDVDLSTDETIRYHQLQSYLSCHAGQVAVAYDFGVFNPQAAARLEVDYVPVSVSGACQHAKLAVVEVHGVDGERAIILGAGSFNLTRAGWWTNIEVGHWVEVSARHAPANIVLPLQAALEYFGRERRVAAIDGLLALVRQWAPGPDDAACGFYFSGAGSSRMSFPAYLRQVDHEWLDVVSPYFPDDGSNTVVNAFLRSFGRPSVLLPVDDSGAAAISEPVYREMSRDVDWKDWHDAMRSGFALSDDRTGYRKLHAKIYAGQDWHFVGSVNLSFKAFEQNIEAGFLLHGALKPRLLGRATEAQGFAAVLPDEGRTMASGLAMPPIELCYDWQAGQLEVLSPQQGVLTLLDVEGGRYGDYAVTAGQLLALPIAGLAQQLKQSSLIAALWTDPFGMQSAQRTLLVSQRHLFCRPTALPALSVRDLLRIFQHMQPDARADIVAQLAARKIRMEDDGSASSEFLPAPQDDAQPVNFFSEFSEVNGAFWNLRQKLDIASRAEKYQELAYYLVGQQPDSLPSLVKSLQADAAGAELSLIVRYLTLLHLDELLARYPAYSAGLSAQVAELISLAERAPQFDELPAGYLDWIKDAFRSPLRLADLTLNQEPSIG